jgi:hypothetical protein
MAHEAGLPDEPPGEDVRVPGYRSIQDNSFICYVKQLNVCISDNFELHKKVAGPVFFEPIPNTKLSGLLLNSLLSNFINSR